MTDLDLDTLEAAARAAAEPAPETFSAAAFGAWALAGREYQKATQPEVTLALLTRLREAESRLRDAEAVIEQVRALVEPPKPFELGKSMMRSFDRMNGDLRKTLATYKPTNQEGNTER